jgi:hypothetical protein
MASTPPARDGADDMTSSSLKPSIRLRHRLAIATEALIEDGRIGKSANEGNAPMSEPEVRCSTAARCPGMIVRHQRRHFGTRDAANDSTTGMPAATSGFISIASVPRAGDTIRPETPCSRIEAMTSRWRSMLSLVFERN